MESIPEKHDLKIFLFHPTAIIVMFILDWGGLVLEIPETLSPFLLIFSSLALFVVSGAAVFFLQKHFAGEDSKTAGLKAGIAGLICAVPYPVMSSLVGTIILALSGFDAIKHEGMNGLIDMFKAKS